MQYRDGWALYYWHGTSIPEKWITNGPEITDALTHENLEERRCAAEIIGWARVLKELNPRIINTHDDPQIGQLIEVDIPDIGREKFLRVACGTAREFALAVPPEMKTAHEANAWTWARTPETYNPEVRT
jgi:hypothetical protein